MVKPFSSQSCQNAQFHLKKTIMYIHVVLYILNCLVVGCVYVRVKSVHMVLRR